jgi:hypothetical protein
MEELINLTFRFFFDNNSTALPRVFVEIYLKHFHGAEMLKLSFLLIGHRSRKRFGINDFNFFLKRIS